MRAEKLCVRLQKAGTAYSQALLSGDVAAALSLLKRLTKPQQRKQKRELLIPPDELQACEVRPAEL